jgi:predicted SPOUT superfamily RNA methylase MTH1
VHIPVGTRITVRIIEDGEHLKAELVDPTEIEEYWGYKVTTSKDPFSRMLKKKRFDLVVATSRKGESLTKIADSLLAELKKAKSVLVAFGSPTNGLQEIVAQERHRLEEISDFVINTIPNQATATVRTEEALYATLTALNLLRAREQHLRQG